MEPEERYKSSTAIDSVLISLLGGLGLSLLGIHHLTEGVKGLASDALRWSDDGLRHAWRLVESLRLAAGHVS